MQQWPVRTSAGPMFGRQEIGRFAVVDVVVARAGVVPQAIHSHVFRARFTRVLREEAPVHSFLATDPPLGNGIGPLPRSEFEALVR